MFFVASAPLQADGHVNLSPKGLDSFRIIDERTVMYLDLTGSGAETVAHLKENGRITIMFCAFSGNPQIVRLFGTGSPIDPGAVGWDAAIARFPTYPAVRSVIAVDIHMVGSSCGFGVPLMDLVSDRGRLLTWAEAKGEEAIPAYLVVQERHEHRWPSGDRAGPNTGNDILISVRCSQENRRTAISTRHLSMMLMIALALSTSVCSTASTMTSSRRSPRSPPPKPWRPLLRPNPNRPRPPSSCPTWPGRPPVGRSPCRGVGPFQIGMSVEDAETRRRDVSGGGGGRRSGLFGHYVFDQRIRRFRPTPLHWCGPTSSPASISTARSSRPSPGGSRQHFRRGEGRLWRRGRPVPPRRVNPTTPI